MKAVKAVKRLLALTMMGLVQVASAHPGPAGHTHEDDWPFGEWLVGLPLALVAVSLLVFRYSKSADS